MYDWIINVVLDRCFKIFEIKELVYKYHVKLYILKELVNDCLRFACIQGSCIYTLLHLNDELRCFLAQIISVEL